MSLFDRVPDSRFLVASARSVAGVSHDFEDDLVMVKRCPDIQGDRCYGLYAKQDLDDETPIGEYIGRILNRQQSLGLCECKRVYLFQITDNRYIDASDPLQSSAIRYINHPHDGEGANATFVKRAVKGLGVRWRIYAVTLRKIMAGEQLLCMYDETPGDRDQILTMTKSEVRSALRKRTSEVAQLREDLANSRAALEEHRLTAACWKRQCTRIASSATRDERKRCQKEMRGLADKLELSGIKTPYTGRGADEAGCQRNSDSSEDTS